MSCSAACCVRKCWGSVALRPSAIEECKDFFSTAVAVDSSRNHQR